jgi:murein DD-endopeptidase MepM/ murein hydrolase activator NlpD
MWRTGVDRRKDAAAATGLAPGAFEMSKPGASVEPKVEGIAICDAPVRRRHDRTPRTPLAALGTVRTAMKSRARVARCAIVAALTLSVSGAASSDAPLPVPAPLYTPFQHAPMDRALELTGSFGEYRPGRFHAGLDYSTGEQVGEPVLAPLDGWIERVRASGAGYGRSIYVRAHDGRLVVLAHLDAFDQPFASFVAAAQESTGQYEQDLWPAGSRFAVHAGQRLGWSGQSGIGVPHLHLEVRRGDMALHPMLAGAPIPAGLTPHIGRIAIEPRGAGSRVNGSDHAWVLSASANAETVRVTGEARVIVEAHETGVRRADLQPWEIAMNWGTHHIACCFDSLSWAGDMPEGDLVFDRGFALPAAAHAVRLWAPGGFRPRAITTDVPLACEAGVLGDGVHEQTENVRIVSRDLNGNIASRALVVRYGSASREAAVPVARSQPASGRLAAWSWSFAADARYDSVSIVADTLAHAARAGDLEPFGTPLEIGPREIVLRRAFALHVALPPGTLVKGLSAYVNHGSGWEFVRSQFDAVESEMTAEPSQIGRFALFRDSVAPHVTLHSPPAHAPRTPYPSWALECRAKDDGSGIDVRASYLIVDGRRRPTEWDPEAGVLRWKPLAAPARGTHRYSVIATDRAGNVARASGHFVLD